MVNIVIQTKLYRPPVRPDCVQRSRLLAHLTLQPQTKLVLISAPAGYGKTTLMVNWLDSLDKRAVCWLALNEDDSAPRQFFTYMARAIEGLPDAGQTLVALLNTGQNFPAKTMVQAFLGDVAGVSVPFVLALDDYHVLDSAELDAALALMIEHMPPHMTLALTTRHDPGFPIARMRGRGELIEVRADALCFTEEEAANFLYDKLNLPLSTDQVSALEQRTEGWIAGLQMAALSIQGRTPDDLKTFVQGFTGSHRFIMDYLTDEVLARLSANMQSFLIGTAMLDRFNADLCDVVLGIDNSQALLDWLEDTNSFIVSLDDERHWFRYHHLFSDLLRQKVPVDIAQSTLRQAATWSAQNGLTTDAIEYAVAAGDWNQVEPLLEQHGLTLLFEGRLTALRRWYEALPTERLWGSPRLCINYAWVLLNQGQPDAVEPYLISAEQASANAPDIRAVTSVIRANIARSIEDLTTTLREADLTLALTTSDNRMAQSVALLQIGAVQVLSGDTDIAISTLEQAGTTARACQNFNVALLAGGYLGIAHLLRSDSPAARLTFQDTRAYATKHNLDQSTLLTYLHIGCAYLALIAGNQETARFECKQARTGASFTREAGAACRADLLLALVEWTVADKRETSAALDRATTTASGLKNPAINRQVDGIRALVTGNPSVGDLESAGLLALGALPPNPTSALPEPLSKRELQILQMIADGLKNQEIADQLYISLNTVLYHTKNVYSKLGVNKRMLAVRRAKELDLL